MIGPIKITLEFDPTETNSSAPVAAAPAPTPAVMPEPMPAPTPKPQEQPKPPQPVEEVSAEPAPKGGSGDFTNMGGISNISDPQKGNPSVYNFQMPREE